MILLGSVDGEKREGFDGVGHRREGDTWKGVGGTGWPE